MSTPDYARVLRRTRRRAILEILAEADENAASEIMLEPVLAARRVYGSDRDAIRTEIAWLGDQGLVKVEDIGGVLFCTLLAGGASIAAGRRVHPDVEKRPLNREA
jgi:hypothetical protein